jgi:SAM-dependent methyltransferase
MMILEPEVFRDLFFNGMKRGLPRDLPVPPSGTVLNLGAGNHPIKGAVNLDAKAESDAMRRDVRTPLPPGSYRWNAPLLRTIEDESVGAIHAYHFLEHLGSDDVHLMIREIARVLKPKGVFWYCVPYALSPIAFMDVDHISFWTEETMRTLLSSRGYDSAATDLLTIQFQIIAGITSQNLAVLGALQKEGEK